MQSRCYEGFPITILDGTAFGKPTIGPDQGGFTEIIGKGASEIGKLFKPNDTQDLEKTMVSLWNNPEEIQELGQKAFTKLQNEYSSEVVFKKWMNLFNELKLSNK